MSGTHVEFAYPLGAGHLGGADDATACRDHVIEDESDLAFERGANDVRLLRFGGARTSLIDNRDRPAQLLLMDEHALDAALVRTQYDKIVLWERYGRPDVLVNNRRGVQVIDRDIEKALNLCCVQVKRQYALGTGRGQQIGDELRRDRHTADVLAVLPGVAIVGQYRRDPRSTGPLEAVDHDQQLHEVIVHRRTRWLDDEDFLAADVFVDLQRDFAVREVRQRHATQTVSKVLSDLLGERQVCPPAEQLELEIVMNHGRSAGT